ncbi:elongator complex protein 3 [Desulfolithobacter sp.]
MSRQLVIPVFIPHEGCPHCCVFCNQHRITCQRRNVTAADIHRIIEDWLGYGRGKPTTVQVAFFGGSFTGLGQERQEELLGAVQPWLERNQVHSIRLSTRPDYINTRVTELLCRYRVRVVELGVQSMDDNVLEGCRRGHLASHTRQAIPLLRQAGLRVGAQLMVGMPGDSRQSLRATVDAVIALNPDFVRIYPLLILAGSELEHRYKQGQYRPLSLDYAVLLAVWMKKRFDAAGISVVRMGLQAGPELEEALVAGPYHPAFGELVQSRIMLQKARKLLSATDRDKKYLLRISNRDQSIFRGFRSANLRRLAQLGLLDRFTLHPDPAQDRMTLSLVPVS